MLGQTNLNLFQAGLPQVEKKRIWSKKIIESCILEDKDLKPYLHEDSTYALNPHLLALYNFAQTPIAGKYKSVIFDQRKGIVLSKRCSRQLVHELFKKKLLFGASLQKHINEMLGFKYHHVISVWQHAYFSLNGYFDQNTDWISLHQMQDYQVKGNELKFISNSGHEFKFKNCQRHLPQRIGESITHNWILGKIIKESFREMGLHLHSCRRLTHGDNILHNERFILEQRIINHDEIMLKEIMTKLQALNFEQFSKAIGNLFDLKLNQDDLRLIQAETKRDDSVY